MVKLTASLLSFTLTTSLALALPHPSYNHGLEEFSGREYLMDDLAAREPGFFDDLAGTVKSVSNAVAKPLQIAKRVVNNPIVKEATSVIPGGTAIRKAIGTVDNIANKAKQVEGVIAKGKNAIRTVTQPPVKLTPKLLGGIIKPAVKPLGAAVNNIIKPIKPLGPAVNNVIKAVKSVDNIGSGRGAHHHHHRRHHGHRRYRRDLEDNELEELSRRDLEAEDFFEREYDDFLAERDFFDDLD
jgi:hypothetical protein